MKLPNLLLLHLKRFDFDVRTFRTVKLNQSISFPLELDMHPYTEAGIQQREKQRRLAHHSRATDPGACPLQPEQEQVLNFQPSRKAGPRGGIPGDDAPASGSPADRGPRPRDLGR